MYFIKLKLIINWLKWKVIKISKIITIQCKNDDIYAFKF
jgi:hypothetical protein